MYFRAIARFSFNVLYFVEFKQAKIMFISIQYDQGSINIVCCYLSSVYIKYLMWSSPSQFYYQITVKSEVDKCSINCLLSIFVYFHVNLVSYFHQIIIDYQKFLNI